MNTAIEVIASAQRAFGVILCSYAAASGAAAAAGTRTGSSGYPEDSFMARHVPSSSRTEPVVPSFMNPEGHQRRELQRQQRSRRDGSNTVFSPVSKSAAR